MNLLLFSRKYCLVFISFLLLFLLFNSPIFSHSGHPHNSVKPESSPQPTTSNLEEIPSSSSLNQQTPVTKKEMFSNNNNTENNFSLIPKPSELIFLLLLVNPFLLYKLRVKLHSK